jgi:predicted nucleotidyltransferase
MKKYRISAFSLGDNSQYGKEQVISKDFRFFSKNSNLEHYNDNTLRELKESIFKEHWTNIKIVTTYSDKSKSKHKCSINYVLNMDSYDFQLTKDEEAIREKMFNKINIF